MNLPFILYFLAGGVGFLLAFPFFLVYTLVSGKHREGLLNRLGYYRREIGKKSGGTVRLHNLKSVENADKKLVAVSRSGELSVIDEHGREKERYKIPYGAIVSIRDREKVEPGQVVANWDPHTHPIITEVAGTVRFHDFVDGIAVNETVD